MKITQNFIKSLSSSAERYSKTKDNLEARVEPGGKITLSLRYKVGDRKRRIEIAKLRSSKVSHDEARELDLQYQKQLIRLSQYGDLVAVAEKGIARKQQVRAQTKTVAQVSEEYLTEFRKTRKTGVSEVSYHKHILRYIGPINPREVTAPNLQMCIDMVGVDKRTTQRHVGKAITRFWRWMKRRGYVDSREVSLDLERPAERKSKRLYTDEEMCLYLKDTHKAIQAIAYCPMRASELLSLNWDHFEGTRKKGGWHQVLVKSDVDEEHEVRFFLTPQFMMYVEHDDGLFWRGRWGRTPLSQNSLSEVFRDRRKALGIGKKGDGVHIFRKNLGTWAQQQKIPDREWQACLGHAIAGLTGVYGLFEYQDEKRELWERWAKHLDSIRGI